MYPENNILKFITQKDKAKQRTPDWENIIHITKKKSPSYEERGKIVKTQ